MNFRIEHDLLGEMNVPADALYGIHTMRALNNFPLGSGRISDRLLDSILIVKKACAITNCRLGYLESAIADDLVSACDLILAGSYRDSLCIDKLCGGAGTSINMMINEVLANVALLKRGKKPGTYHEIDPLVHVNMHQSTNDVFPTAIKVGAITMLRELSAECAKLQGAFQRKEALWAHVIMMGRTECMDAVPMTMGAQFSSFAEAISRDRWRTFKCEERLRVVNLGGTAIGTGLTAPRDYIFAVTDTLRELTGYGCTRGENMVDATANADAFVEVSGILMALAVNHIKIAQDIRHLHMLGELQVQSVAAGSSIMPGKVNPVILESVIQCAMRSKSECALVAECASRGTLQINEFLPLLADSLYTALSLLITSSKMFAKHIDHIEVNEKLCLLHAGLSTTIVTALIPVIGYERAQELVKLYAKDSSGSFLDFLKIQVGQDIVESNFSPSKLMSLGHEPHGNNA